MQIDLGMLGLVILFGFIGASLGGMMQIASLAGYAAGWLGAKPLAKALTPLAVAQFHYSPVVTGAVLALVLFSVLAGVGGAVARAIYLKMFDGPDGIRTDRKFGFIIGSIKAAGVLYLLA